MTQSRLLFFGFAGLAAYITYNALFLQKGPHPAPFSADIGAGDVVGSTGMAGRRQPAARKVVAATTDTVRAIQRELAGSGYDPGPADGVAGLLTRAAIMAYEHDHNLPLTGEATDILLKRILLGVSPNLETDTASQPPDTTVALVKAVQQILANMGYQPGPVDGILGAGTRRAIENFEKDRNLPVKGRISGRLLKEIIKVTGAKLDGIS